MWQKLLQLQFAPNPGELLHWMVQAGMETTIRAYGGCGKGSPRAVTVPAQSPGGRALCAAR
jgi:serine/threonine protein phosphatase 1